MNTQLVIAPNLRLPPDGRAIRLSAALMEATR